jgi:uncharacterized protein
VLLKKLYNYLYFEEDFSRISDFLRNILQKYRILLYFCSQIILILSNMFKYRDLLTDIENHLYKKEYTIITGARQVGKTTILKYLYNKFLEQNEDAYYLSFEDPEILENINTHPENIFRYVSRSQKKQPADRKYRKFIFIDEIQYASNPSNFLKYFYDTYAEDIKIIVTGSSAFYIDSKFNDSLAGRKKVFILKSLNFSEFLQFKDAGNLFDELKVIRNNSEYLSIHNNELINYFEEYLVFGGFPAVVLEQEQEDKISRLLELRNSFVKKDLYETGITNETTFFNIFKILASQIGNLVNKNELSKILRINNKIVDQYIYVLQKCFHIALIKPFYKNLRKELTKMNKVYFYDIGLRNALLNRLYPLKDREDIGQLLENYVFIRLSENFNEDEINYWRTADGNEVDFVISPDGNKGKAYEIKYNLSAFHPGQYKKFISNYPEIMLSCISFVNVEEKLSMLKF